MVEALTPLMVQFRHSI